MRYEAYQNRIKKVAEVLQRILRVWPLILIVLVIVTAALTAFITTRGMIMSFDCPSSVAYGDEISCKANAFLSKTRIEYSDGSGEWSEDASLAPGKYKVRAVGKGFFGIQHYSDPAEIVIEKRRLEVHSANGSVNYGEDPVLSADLAYEDILYCDQFEFGDIFLKSDGEISSSSIAQFNPYITAMPVRSSIVIKDKDGNDVTYAYEISVKSEELKVIPRKITVTVEDASKIYDGVKLAFDAYGLSGGELAKGDTLYAYFDKYIIDAGSIENTPSFVLMSSKGVDVTLCYSIEVVKGMLTVEKRPLMITTGSGEFVYDGKNHSVEEFSVSSDTPLAEGQSLSLLWGGVADAGEHKNIPTVLVRASDNSEVTHNYSVFFEAGTLKITPLQITVATADATVVYSGSPYSFSQFGFNIKSGKILDGHYIDTVSSSSAEEAGEYKNDLSIAIHELFSGKEVTHNYEITYEYGTVEIKKRPVTFETGSLSWIYDGEEHRNENYTHSEISYYDKIIVTESTGITDVGSVENRLTIKIVRGEYTYGDTDRLDGGTLPDIGVGDSNAGDSNGDHSENWRDMSHNYEITFVYGTLTVNPRPVAVKPVDAQKVYDGTPLTASAIEITALSPYELVAGHTISDFKTNDSQTDVGTKTNYIVDGSVRISDSSGKDVTRNYDLLLSVGGLTVTPREILVETGSASKKYDGMPLTNGDFGVSANSPNQLVNGHTLYVENMGERTEIGITDNFCDIYKTKLQDVNGRDVTSNYLVSYLYGILEVYEDEQGGGGTGGSGGLGGSGGGSLNEGGEIGADQGNSEGDPSLALKLKDEKNGYLYLKLKSFGGYTGRSWNEATEYSEKIDGLYSAGYLAALALGQTDHNLDIEVMGDQYFLPYYISIHGMSNHDIQSSDVIYRGDASKIYTVSYKDYNYKTKYELSSQYSEFEKAYRSFVYSQYLIIDEETRVYMEAIIEKQGFVGNDIETILRVAEYVQNSARYNIDYDRALDKEENIAIAFLDSYREGICQHYATAATLMFRVMGIPARYTIGYVSSTKAGEWVEVYADQAHAWVEVYIDGFGWIEIEVTGGSGFGLNGSGGALPKGTITVKPTYQYKKYDGRILYAKSEIEFSPLLKELVDNGYSFSVSVTGKQREIGRSESVASEFVLYDPLGNDVTNDYEIVYQPGILEVLTPDVTVVSVELYQLQKYYDGKPISFEEGDYSVKYERLQEPGGDPVNVNLDVKLNISLTNVGCLTLSELNENIDEYVTLEVVGGDPAYFKVVFTAPEGSWRYIPIRVDARPLTLTASSATKEYDGKYLTSDDFYITKGSLCEGHTLTATLNGSIKSPGEEINMITNVTILDELGNDVTENYNISTVDGMLTVTE